MAVARADGLGMGAGAGREGAYRDAIAGVEWWLGCVVVMALPLVELGGSRERCLRLGLARALTPCKLVLGAVTCGPGVGETFCWRLQR